MLASGLRWKVFLSSLAGILLIPPLGSRNEARQIGPASPQSHAESGTASHAAMPGMDQPESTATLDHEEQEVAMDAMSHEHMHMSVHMQFTELRPTNAADQKRAAELVQILRASIARYRDYHVAQEEGYTIFLPRLPQAIYHFNNYENGLNALFDFDPVHPTSLLYKKTAGGYELLGAMYTAPRNTTEDELDRRVPLSVVRWHQHVNICLPQKGQVRTVDFALFGPHGSISTAGACSEAGGRWFPVIFGWMVHVYPFEKDPAKIWAH